MLGIFDTWKLLKYDHVVFKDAWTFLLNGLSWPRFWFVYGLSYSM